MMVRFKVGYEEVRKRHLSQDYIRFHFTSKRKRMSTIIENCGPTEHGYDKRVHLKGASEIVLASCDFYLDGEGRKVPLPQKKKLELEDQIDKYAKQALRTICFAYKDLRPNEGGHSHEDKDENGYLHVIEKTGFTLISLVGIRDIIRDEVPKAI